MSERFEAGSPAAESVSHVHEAPVRTERLSIPEEVAPSPAPRASLQNGPDDYRPEIGSTVFASSRSTRWTHGRGNKSLLSRSVGVVVETGITIGAVFVRGGLYALRDGYTWGRSVLAAGTDILKDWGHIPRGLGFLAMIPVALAGAACGAVRGAVVGAATAAYDGYRGIISVASGGEAYYFKFANRAYRD